MDSSEQDLKKYLVSIGESERRTARTVRRWSLVPLAIGLVWMTFSVWKVSEAEEKRELLENQITELQDRKLKLVQDNNLLQQRADEAAQAAPAIYSDMQALAAARETVAAASSANPSTTIEELKHVLTTDVKPSAEQRAKELWARGYQAYLSSNRKDAKKYYSLAAEADASYAPALNSLGRLAGEEGDKAEEEKKYREALKNSDDTYVPALNNLARVEYAKGNLDDAERLAKGALKLRPGYAISKELLSEIADERSRKKTTGRAGGP
jgi:tetratricopeptide (TPR) repeat protein